MKHNLLRLMLCTMIVSMGMAFPAFGAYSDVPANHKYAADVAAVTDMGIMTGSSSTYFGVDDPLSYMEAVAVAAKAHSLVHKKTIPKANGVWYEGALRYCRENGMLHPDMERSLKILMPKIPGKSTYYNDVFKPHLIHMLADVMPEETLPAINHITRIPDSSTMGMEIIDDELNEDDKDVVMFYRAGIMEGVGRDHSYHPYHIVTRGEAAAFINRLFHPEARVHFEILPIQNKMEYTPAPDGSNIGKKTGTIYPREGDLFNGKPITRDPVTGVLGYGNGQKGWIYYGLLAGYHAETGKPLYLGIAHPMNTNDYCPQYCGGHYSLRGEYLYFDNEWVRIEVEMRKKLDAQYPNAPDGTCADIYGNILPGAKIEDEDVFFYFSDYCWMPKTWID